MNMSIKTNELQQIVDPQLTDTLLLADSAGGTAQLSLAQAAAFLGAEMVKEGNPVSTALSSKAALSAQETVEKTAAVTKQVSLTAAEVIPYIRAMPRLLTENYNFSVSGGTLDAALTFASFYGPGHIWFNADSDLILNKGLMIYECSAYIRIIGPKVQGVVPGESSFVLVRNSQNVSLEQVNIDGEYGTSERSGITAQTSRAAVLNCAISNVSCAVRSIYSSLMSVNNLTGSGNTVGGQVYRGGVLLLGDNTPELMGGASNSKKGGLIVNCDGTLL